MNDEDHPVIYLVKHYLNNAANMVFTAPKLERSNSSSWLSDSTAYKHNSDISSGIKQHKRSGEILVSLSHLKTSSVILAPFVRIRQDVIWKCNLFKHISSFRIICILVRMIPKIAIIYFILSTISNNEKILKNHETKWKRKQKLL